MSQRDQMTDVIIAIGSNMGDRRHVQANPDVVRVLEGLR